MARKLLDQNEVARLLGITPDEVASLRDRKMLFPYRDGDQWKFKQEDVERYREEMQAEKQAQGGGEATDWKTADDLGDVELQLNDDLDSILLSEIELGKSSTEGASTIIGKPGEISEADNDLPPVADAKKTAGAKLPEGKKPPSADDSDITLAMEPGAKGGSTITLAGQPASGGSSGFSLAGDSAVTMGADKSAGKDAAKPGSGKGGSGFGLAATDSGISLSDSNLSLASDVKLVAGGSGDVKKSGGSSDKLFGSDALQLSDDELALVDAPSSPDKSKGGDASKRSGGSSIKLGDEELEVVLGSGSDVTQSPTDSGIQLISASDSGLSLDQPLQLGSSARRLLDIEPGAESVEEVGAGSHTDQKSDDDFLLTTSDEISLQESSDSGSQVIALDTDDELSSGMFGSAATATGLLEEETTASAEPAGMPAALMGVPSLGGSPGMMAAATSPAQSQYSGANIAILAVCTVLLLFCGMLTYDLMRNMWSWDGPYQVNSSIMDSIGNTVGWLEK